MIKLEKESKRIAEIIYKISLNDELTEKELNEVNKKILLKQEKENSFRFFTNEGKLKFSRVASLFIVLRAEALYEGDYFQLDAPRYAYVLKLNPVQTYNLIKTKKDFLDHISYEFFSKNLEYAMHYFRKHKVEKDFLGFEYALDVNLIFDETVELEKKEWENNCSYTCRSLYSENLYILNDSFGFEESGGYMGFGEVNINKPDAVHWFIDKKHLISEIRKSYGCKTNQNLLNDLLEYADFELLVNFHFKDVNCQDEYLSPVFKKEYWSDGDGDEK